MRLQVGKIGRIPIDDLEDVLPAPGTEGRRYEALHVEHVGVEEEVHHRLQVVRVRAADVRRDEDALSGHRRRTLL